IWDENFDHSSFWALPLRENSFTPVKSEFRYFSSVNLVLEVPIIAYFSGKRLSRYRLYNAGIIFLLVKSPVPPKMIKMVGFDFFLDAFVITIDLFERMLI